MKPLRRAKVLAYIFIPVSLVVLANIVGLRYNYSHSVAGKLWFEKSSDNFLRGDYVFLCIKDEQILKQLKPYLIDGDCGGSVAMLKKIVGIAGDEARFSPEGIFINGKRIDQTKPVDNDNLLYKLKAFEKTLVLPSDHVVLVGETRDSLDSRYYGPIDTKWLTGKAIKLL